MLTMLSRDSASRVLETELLLTPQKSMQTLNPDVVNLDYPQSNSPRLVYASHANMLDQIGFLGVSLFWGWPGGCLLR